MWGWVAFVGFAGSFGVAVVADKAGASLDTIGGIMLVGLTTSVVGLIARAWNGHVRSEATRDAFQAYNDGLARRLGVCVSGLAIVPCETPVDAEPMPGAVIEDPVLRSLRQK